jgi:DNA gyrase subunit A
MNLSEGEKLAAILPIQAEGYIAFASRTGMVRLLRHHVFGEYMKPAMALFDPKNFGPLAAACWTPGDGDIFIATRQGRAIRFSEKLIPPQGGLGVRLSNGDEVVGIAGIYEDSGVFLLGADGRGTIRLMEGFNANKAPGAGGKTAMATDHLVGAQTAITGSDIFVISTLSKIIRFRSAEIPAKEGVVQGVNCMSFRADRASAITVS